MDLRNLPACKLSTVDRLLSKRQLPYSKTNNILRKCVPLQRAAQQLELLKNQDRIKFSDEIGGPTFGATFWTHFWGIVLNAFFNVGQLSAPMLAPKMVPRNCKKLKMCKRCFFPKLPCFQVLPSRRQPVNAQLPAEGDQPTKSNHRPNAQRHAIAKPCVSAVCSTTKT